MKVRPMIFNTEMVKAILEGEKTVTRRPAKNLSFSDRVGYVVGEWAYGIGFDFRETMNNCIKSKSAKCPAQVGDLIYVRETLHGLYAIQPESDHYEFSKRLTRDVRYVADGGDLPKTTLHCKSWKSVPSIHMPRWASRLTLKVTDVRIERLQEITEDQCWKEGIESTIGKFDIFQLSEMAKKFGGTFEDAKSSFACLWDSIYKNWDENPYVWVIEFEVIHQNVDKYLSSLD